MSDHSRTTPWLAGVLCVCSLFAVPSTAGAGSPLPVADLALDLQVVPDLEIYPPDTLARIDLTIDNLGPESVVAASVAFGQFTFGGFGNLGAQVTIVPFEETAPCVYSSLDLQPPLPDFLGFWFVSLAVPGLAAGESVVCSVYLRTTDYAWGSYLLEATVLSPGITGQEFSDPNSTNNHVARPIVITPPDAPPPQSDLEVTLSLVPEQDFYPPGSDVRMHLRLDNHGPVPSSGSQFLFEQARSLIDARGILLTQDIQIIGDVDNQYCMYQWLPDPERPGVEVLSAHFPGIFHGQPHVCQLRMRVLEGASGSLLLSGHSSPTPFYGDATGDPNPDNDAASLLIRISPSGIAEPVAVPALGRLAVFLLGGLLIAVAFRALRRVKVGR